MSCALATSLQQVEMPSFSRKGNTITVLLTTFAGLGLPRTLSLPVSASASVHDVLQAIYSRLPQLLQALIVTTTSNKQLLASDPRPISSHLSSDYDTFIPLRLSARLCGGKGGFGSQLRAAGGRMSSRKNRNQQNQNPNGSSRNLDGRRIRTVDTVKRLAQYLEEQPRLEAQAKKDRIEGLQKKIDDAEKKAENIKSGRSGNNQGRLDAEYIDQKQAEEEKTAEAVRKALRDEMMEPERTGSESSMECDDDASDNGERSASSASSEGARPQQVQKPRGGLDSFWGEEDDYDDDDDDDAETPSEPTYEGKGKGRVA